MRDVNGNYPNGLLDNTNKKEELEYYLESIKEEMDTYVEEKISKKKSKEK